MPSDEFFAATRRKVGRAGAIHRRDRAVFYAVERFARACADGLWRSPDHIDVSGVAVAARAANQTQGIWRFDLQQT